MLHVRRLTIWRSQTVVILTVKPERTRSLCLEPLRTWFDARRAKGPWRFQRGGVLRGKQKCSGNPRVNDQIDSPFKFIFYLTLNFAKYIYIKLNYTKRFKLPEWTKSLNTLSLFYLFYLILHLHYLHRRGKMLVLMRGGSKVKKMLSSETPKWRCTNLILISHCKQL